MSSKSFVKLLRKIIRQAVQDAVRTVLTDQPDNHTHIIEHGTTFSHVADSPQPHKKQMLEHPQVSQGILDGAWCLVAMSTRVIYIQVCTLVVSCIICVCW